MYGDLDTVCVTPPVRRRFEPDTARSDKLRARHARFGKLYLALRCGAEGDSFWVELRWRIDLKPPVGAKS